MKLLELPTRSILSISNLNGNYVFRRQRALQSIGAFEARIDRSSGRCREVSCRYIAD